MSKVIGIDIGGTHIDGVVVDAKGQIESAVKVELSGSITQSLEKTFLDLLQKGAAKSIKRVCIGTTQMLNALLEAKGLERVGVIRIAGHSPDLLPAGSLMSPEIKAHALAGMRIVDGGFECDGSPITSFDENQVEKAILELADLGISAFAVVGCFSSINPSQEEAVGRLIEKFAPDIPYTLSHEVGGIGFIERENSAIINASLLGYIETCVAGLQDIVAKSSIQAPVLISSNNGTVMSVDQVTRCPIFTLASGPANSAMGAAKLAKVDHALIVDVGGTTTDVAIVKSGHMLSSHRRFELGGITFGFSAPLTLSCPVGGGTAVAPCGALQSTSLGGSLKSNSVAFGGDVMTLTDAAIKLELIDIPGARAASVPFSSKFAQRVIEKAKKRIESLVRKLKRKEGLPVLFVGGAAPLFAKKYELMDHFHVCNAYGAALGQVSASIEEIVPLDKQSEILPKLTDKAFQKAVKRGADIEALRVVHQSVHSMPYTDAGCARLLIVVSGPFATS